MSILSIKSIIPSISSISSLLDSVMKEPVLIQHDDDVEVFNNNAGPKYYQTRGPPTLDDEM